MGNLSDKIKIIYLTAVILFAAGVFFYLLDSWGVINLENYVPGLEEEAAVVSEDNDSPSALEWQRLEKERNRLEEERLKLDEERLTLQESLKELERREEELAEKSRGLSQQEKELEEARARQKEREERIAEMADRMSQMPPADAVAIADGWSNTDLVDVFLQMEENAAEAGQPSIVPFLLTQLPRERASLITTLMLDAEANKLPE